MMCNSGRWSKSGLFGEPGWKLPVELIQLMRGGKRLEFPGLHRSAREEKWKT